MNILLINSFYYPNMPGGAEHSVKNLCETFVARGHKISVLCTDIEDKYEKINGVEVYRIKNINIKSSVDYCNSNNNSLQKVIYRGLDLHGYLNKNKIINIIDKIKPDVVHINNIPGIGLNIFKLLKNKKIPTVFTVRDYYTMCSNSTLMKSNGEICKNKKYICKIYEFINKNNIVNADYITAPSEFSLNLIKKVLNSKNIKYRCINNSIDINENYLNEVFRYKEKKIQQKEGLDLVFLGKLDQHKGIKILIDYIVKLNDKSIRLHIAGDGPLSDYVKSYNKKEIIYYGKKNINELDELLKEMDVLIAPSMWYEPFGRIVIDAYKYCMPVISTGNGGLKELIKENETGYITNFKNIDDFKRIIKLYKDKSLLLMHMENCKKEALKYSNDLIIEKYENLYKEMIKNRRM